MVNVNESIQVALNDGSSLFAFWSRGGQGLVLRSIDFLGVDSSIALKCEQVQWLKQELEASRMTRHHIYAFVDCSPEKLLAWLIRMLAKGRVMCLFGPHSDSAAIETEYTYECSVNDDEKSDDRSLNGGNHDDDSLSSTKNVIDDEECKMKIIARGDGTLRSWRLEEYVSWEFKDVA